MAGKLNTALFSAAVVIAVLSRWLAAQKVYTVGDAMGWLVPPNGASTYTTWAAKKSFTVGDILVLNFASGNHDVAEVTKANFNGCKTTSPISKTSKTSANITLKSAGEHYYICTFNGHCSGGGQKLAINVSAASSTPAPQPSVSSLAPVLAPVSPSMAPGPELAPAPGLDSPAGPRLPMTYTVGDALGWNVPSNGSTVGYQNWASDKDFVVGDTLGGGQKLAINVSAASSTPAPQPSVSSLAPFLAPVSPSMAPGPELAPAPRLDSPAGPRLPMTYTVGDALGWNVPSNGSTVGYQNWASDKDFVVGDTLVFNYVNGTHNVAEVTKQSYNSCNTSNHISLNTNPPTRITLNITGIHYFTCTFSRHCNLGQQLAINVNGTAASIPPSPDSGMSPSPTATPPSTASAGSSEFPSSPAGSPPPLNSATLLGVESLSVTILVSIVVALVIYI